jgi:hypothetical protein
MTEEMELAIENVRHGFENYGYWVASEPIEGEEELYLENLREGLKLVETNADFFRRRYNLRGHSKRLLEMLHSSTPEPTFGVRVQP